MAAQPTRRESPASLTARQLTAAAAEELISPAAWLVFALLSEQPSHGYELSRRYQRRFGSVRPMSVPRVYGALERLREAGLIEPFAPRRGKSASRQEQMRRSYRPTHEGEEAYRRWLVEQMREGPARPQLLAQIVSAGLLGTGALLQIVDRYQRECMEDLRGLPTESERVETGAASLEELLEVLMLDQQRRELGARNDWAAHARQVLEAYAHRTAAVGSKPAQDDP